MTDDPLAHLLAVQDLDTTITQLQHRRAALVESSGLAAVEGQLASLEAERADAAARRAVLTATQKDLEEQIAVISERSGAIEKRMYAATSSSGRDLQAMNEEVRHLTERRAELEELELVAMLEQDPIDAELAALRERDRPARGAGRRAAPPGGREPGGDRRRAGRGDRAPGRPRPRSCRPHSRIATRPCGPASRAPVRRAWWAVTATVAISSCRRSRSRRSAPCRRARWPPVSSAAAFSFPPDVLIWCDRADPRTSR